MASGLVLLAHMLLQHFAIKIALRPTESAGTKREKSDGRTDVSWHIRGPVFPIKRNESKNNLRTRLLHLIGCATILVLSGFAARGESGRVPGR